MIRFFNAGTQVLNAWTPTNTNTNVPRAVSGDPNENSRMSTRFLEDGSYFQDEEYYPGLQHTEFHTAIHYQGSCKQLPDLCFGPESADGNQL